MNKTWDSNKTVCAATLNSISGWRLALAKKRDPREDFLQEPLFSGCLEQKSLQTMMDVIKDNRSWSQDIFAKQAEYLKIDSLGPWDRFSPFPSENSGKKTFDEAIDLIKSAFASVDSSMADFVQEMVDQKWIEGSLGPKKRPGAYCTKFLKSRNPRVYMTYTGGMKDIITLAHELGHAYHNWMLRSEPLAATYYPMTLAETASIFAQTLVMDFMLENSSNETERKSIQWSIARDVEGFLINIPVRFDFEKKVYEEREQGALSPKRFNEIMSDCWNDWYGEALSEPDPLFWASKLHFHLSYISFYNFPYSFGYLFAIGVYAQRDSLGSNFLDRYVQL